MSSPAPPYRSREHSHYAATPPNIPTATESDRLNADSVLTYFSINIGIGRKRKLDGVALSTRRFLLLMALLFLASFGLFASVFPITRCNDPADPAVRERIRKEWNIEWRQHEQQKQQHLSERDEWRREQMSHEEVRREWQREVEEHNRQQEEKREQEDDERRRLGLSWNGLKGQERCLSYSTREYTAQLENIPTGYDRIKACMSTPVVIHGVTFERPNRCEDDGQSGVYGHWLVNHNEPSCSTYWSYFKDKGCVSQGSGTRRIESPLENLQGGDDWREMCTTTPADFRRLHFSGPDYCVNWGQHGIWGIWEIDDSSC